MAQSILVTLVAIVLWVGLFNTILGKIASYALLVFTVYALAKFHNPLDLNKKNKVYLLVIASIGALFFYFAILEFKDHSWSCSGNYNMDVDSRGRYTNNAFSQLQIKINKDNADSVCGYNTTSDACKEYRACLSNPFYSIILFLCLFVFSICATLLSVQFFKEKPIDKSKASAEPSNIDDLIDLNFSRTKHKPIPLSKLIDELKNSVLIKEKDERRLTEMIRKYSESKFRKGGRENDLDILFCSKIDQLLGNKKNLFFSIKNEEIVFYRKKI